MICNNLETAFLQLHPCSAPRSLQDLGTGTAGFHHGQQCEAHPWSNSWNEAVLLHGTIAPTATRSFARRRPIHQASCANSAKRRFAVIFEMPIILEHFCSYDFRRKPNSWNFKM
jgi:hypothetical protein